MPEWAKKMQKPIHVFSVNLLPHVPKLYESPPKFTPIFNFLGVFNDSILKSGLSEQQPQNQIP